MMEEVYWKIEKYFKDYVNFCESTFRSNAPHGKTGDLKASIKSDRESDTAYVIGAYTDYAYWANYGRGEVTPNGKYGGGGKALYWPDLRHPVPRAAPYEGSHYLEKTLSQLGG